MQKKSNRLHYAGGITLNRVTSGGDHLRGLAPEQLSSEETSQWWRVVGDIARFNRRKNYSGNADQSEFAWTYQRSNVLTE